MRAGLTTWKWLRSRRHLKAADAPGYWKVSNLVEDQSELYVRLCMSVVFPPQPWTAVCWEPCVCPSRSKSFSKVPMPSREFPSSKLRVVWAQNHPRRQRQHRQRTRHISISRRELFVFSHLRKQSVRIILNPRIDISHYYYKSLWREKMIMIIITLFTKKSCINTTV